MLRSMTGFARRERATPWGTLACEIRSVNHRFLDAQLRLPDELRSYEGELRRQVGERLGRGKIDCSMHLQRDAGGDAAMTIDERALERLAAGVSRVASALDRAMAGVTADGTRSAAGETAGRQRGEARRAGGVAVDPLEALRWPGVIAETEVPGEALYDEAGALLEETLELLERTRAREGERLAALIAARCEEVAAIAASVRRRRETVLEAMRGKLLERIERLGVELEPGRIETEWALIAQKLDVDEELDRLQSHVAEIREVMEMDQPVGRRLDFLMQELNREANTLGSKSADTETTRAAVDLKVLIEQMREQTQNVE